MKKTITLLALLMSIAGYCGAEEAIAATSNPWMPVVGEVAALVIQIVGPILVILVSAVVWKLLGKIGIDKNAAIDALMTTYVKKGINFADSWASAQKDKPTGDQKLAAAIKHILELMAASQLPKVAEEKLKEMIESQLSFDEKKQPAEAPDPAAAVINE